MLELPGDPGLSVLTYSAKPGSLSEAAMGDLGRWSETRSLEVERQVADEWMLHLRSEYGPARR